MPLSRYHEKIASGQTAHRGLNRHKDGRTARRTFRGYCSLGACKALSRGPASAVVQSETLEALSLATRTQRAGSKFVKMKHRAR